MHHDCVETSLETFDTPESLAEHVLNTHGDRHVRFDSEPEYVDPSDVVDIYCLIPTCSKLGMFESYVALARHTKHAHQFKLINSWYE